MKLQIAVCLASLALSGSALAGDDKHKKQPQPSTTEASIPSDPQQMEQGTGGSGMVDLTKMGPWTRKPADEGKIKKEIQTFFKEDEELMKRRDFNAIVDRIDFPIYMATDSKRGEVQAAPWSREEYVKMMKPMYDQMPADEKYTHKPNITVLSDSMALVVDDFTLRSSGKTYRGKNASLLVKKDGQWKWKMAAEPGWGEMPMEGVGGSGPADAEKSHPDKDKKHKEMPKGTEY